VNGGELLRIPLGADERCEMTVRPAAGLDMGAGPGRAVTRTVRGGTVGLVLDGRGRSIAVPEDPDARRRTIAEWVRSLEAYG
jgi:hypothetical protein